MSWAVGRLKRLASRVKMGFSCCACLRAFFIGAKCWKITGLHTPLRLKRILPLVPRAQLGGLLKRAVNIIGHSKSGRNLNFFRGSFARNPALATLRFELKDFNLGSDDECLTKIAIK
jgi:hypothetical protein